MVLAFKSWHIYLFNASYNGLAVSVGVGGMFFILIDNLVRL